MARCLLLLVMMSLGTTAAQAQWLFRTEENAFEPNKSMHIAMTAIGGGYALGMRCQGGERSVIFMTPEKAESIGVLNSASPVVMIRVDDNDILEYPARLEILGDTVAAGILDADGVKKAFDQARQGQRRISVAIKLLGQTMHPTNFNVRGSTRAITELQSKC